MSDHDWFRDNLALYGAGGLEADEALRFERHAAECASCAQELAQWRLFDRGLERLGAPAHFAADWDGRVLAKVHASQNPPRRRLSAIWRWSAAAAAVLFVGLLGAAVHTVAALGFVAFPGGDHVQAEASMPVVLPVFGMEPEDSDGKVGRMHDVRGYITGENGRAQSMNNLKEMGTHWRSANGERDELAGVKLWEERGGDGKNVNAIDFHPPSFGLITRAPARVHNTDGGGKDKSKDVDGEVADRLGRAMSGLTPAGTLTPDLNLPIKASSFDDSKSMDPGNGAIATHRRDGQQKPELKDVAQHVPTG